RSSSEEGFTTVLLGLEVAADPLGGGVAARADGADGDVEDLADLGVAEAGDLAQDEDAAQLLGQGVDGGAYGGGLLGAEDGEIGPGVWIGGAVIVEGDEETQGAPAPTAGREVDGDPVGEGGGAVRPHPRPRLPQPHEGLLDQLGGLVTV